MGGKTKQSQRTKNNARPSSSGRSAELLASLGGADGKPLTLLAALGAAGGGAGGVGGVGGAVAAAGGAAVAPLDARLAPEVALCFKKLNKKDPITRTKALQELSSLVESSCEEEVAALLGSWALAYPALALDIDRKTRDAAQVCHGRIARAVGRRLAPWLRRVVPPWLVALHDDHGPAAAHAHHALQATFPENKLPEVVSFCKEEVMAYLADNLLGGVELLINNKTEDPEERATQLKRVITASLRTLDELARRFATPAQLPAQLPSPPAAPLAAWLPGAVAPLLDKPAFWKLATHSDHNVRAAWYGAMGALSAAHALGPSAPRLLKALLNAKEGGDAAHYQLLAILDLLHNHQDWHTWLDKNDLLIKRLLDVLENGGWGSGRRVSLVVPPLVGCLPATLLTQQFYHQLFTAAFHGLEQKSVLSSKSERQAWMAMIAECLQQLSAQDHDFVIEVVTSVHRQWVEKVLDLKHPQHISEGLVKQAAAAMAALLKGWLRAAEGGTGGGDHYHQLARNFWLNVGSTIAAQFDNAPQQPAGITRMILTHIQLVLALKAGIAEPKKQLSITFAGDAPGAPGAVVAAPPGAAQGGDGGDGGAPPGADLYQHNLQRVVHDVVALSFQLARDRQVSEPVFSPLVAIVRECGGGALWAAVAQRLVAPGGAGGGNTGGGGAAGLFHSVLLPWLSGDVMRCRPLVDLLFLLLPHLSEDQQDKAFDAFQQFPPLVVEWCLAACTSHPAVTWGAARRWLRGGVATCALARLGQRLVARPSDDVTARELLLAALTPEPEPGAELLASAEAASAVLGTLSAALAAPDGGPNLEPVARTAAQLAAALAPAAGRSPPQGYMQLLHALFLLNLQQPRECSALSADTCREAAGAWRDNRLALPARDRAKLLGMHTAALRERTDRMEELNTSELEHIVSLCPYLVDQSENSIDVDSAIHLTKQLIDDDDVTCDAVVGALRRAVVEGRLNVPFDDVIIAQCDDVIAAEITKSQLVQFVKGVLFRGMYLRTMLLRDHRADSEHEDEDVERDATSENGSHSAAERSAHAHSHTWCAALLADHYFVAQLARLWHDYAALMELKHGYVFWRHYDIILKASRTLEQVMEAITSETNSSAREALTSHLQTMAAERGMFWAYGAWYAHARTGNTGQHTPVHTPLELDVDRLDDVLTGNGFFHSLQAQSSQSSDTESRYMCCYLVMLRSWHAAHAHGDVTWPREAAAGMPAADIDAVVNAYYRNNETMLYERDISTATWRQVVSVSAVADCLAAWVLSRGWDAPPHHWDFVAISLASLANTLERSKHCWTSLKACVLQVSVLRLFTAVERFIAAVPTESTRRQPSDHVAALPNEWRDVFAPDTTRDLFLFTVHVLESSEAPVTAATAATISSLLSVLPRLQWSQLPPAARESLSLERLSRRAAAVLAAPAHHAYKYLACGLLRTIADQIVLEDAEKLSVWSGGAGGEEERAPPQLALTYFAGSLTTALDLLEAALEHLTVGEKTCAMAAWTDGHSLALGALLLADSLFAVCGRQRADLALHYIQLLREERWAEQLTCACLRLLPPDIAAFSLEGAPPPHNADQLFSTAPAPLTLTEPCGSETVGSLSCHVVALLLSGAASGSVRAWWGAAPLRAGRALERLAAQFVTPALVRRQLTELQRHAGQFEDTEITIHWSSGEVECVYSVEERAVPLRLALTAAHPLSLPRADTPTCGHGTPVPNPQFLVLYLAYQNGSVVQALRMWRAAVAAKVESSPQCYICYGRLHHATGRLPNTACKQCRNKYHNDCLRKWFSTSGKTNCPLCRAAF